MTVMVIVVMFGVTMIVLVVMMAVIMMLMIVTAMFLIAMAVVIMPMRCMAATGISSAFRIERRFDGDDARAEATHHFLDDVIAPDAQSLANDLGRQMTIAEMPGDPHQMLRIGAANLNERLGRRDDLDQPPVFQHQRIAATQRHGLFQVQQELQPARAGYRHAPPVPVVETENHRIGGFGPTSRWTNLCRADHDGMLIASGLRRR